MDCLLWKYFFPKSGHVLCASPQGLSDKEVADKLIVSPRTVGNHLQSIYSKLGVSSRAAATRFALDHHLV